MLQDLPVLAIDSFQHMFMFPDMNELSVPGKRLHYFTSYFQFQYI